MEIRSAFSPRLAVQFDQSIPDPVTGELQTSMTKQSFAEESEINNIMAKYEKTGVIEHVKNHGGYADMPGGLDYQSALQITMDAQEAFNDLPAATRREFDNNPASFLDFVADPENVERMAELGLLKPADETPPKEVDPAPGAAEEPAPKADP